MSSIVGISGKIGTGKTTIANFLYEMGAVDRVIAFGDVLKREVAHRFNFDLELCYSGRDQVIFHADLPNGTMSVRQILQWYGTDICRTLDPYYWVKRMEEEIEGLEAENPNIRLAIHDVRFREEAQWVADRGGVLVRVQPFPGWKSGSYAEHRSETDLDDWGGLGNPWDAIIEPTKGINVLKGYAETIAQMLEGD